MVALGSYINGLPTFKQSVPSPSHFTLCSMTDSWTFVDWHPAFGHLGETGTRNALKANNVDLPISPKDVEDVRNFLDCCKGKLHKKSFKSKAPYKCQSPFGVVHSDVAFLSSLSKQGFMYFISFIDEFSKFTICYATKTKDEVLQCFKKYVHWIKQKFKYDLLTLRSDNGGDTQETK